MEWIRRHLWLAGALFCLTPWSSPPLALALGILLALVVPEALPGRMKGLSRLLLQASVVLLGFGMDLRTVLRAGAAGMAFAAATIVLTLVLGRVSGKWLGVGEKTSILISAGTAICGGSAIAAVSTVIGAEEEEISVAIGTVFILNGAALYLFPPLGRMLGLSQEQFGTWAGISIHDISSVVGASSVYGLAALGRATAVKLARALWIAPLSLAAALLWRRRGAPVSGRKGSASHGAVVHRVFSARVPAPQLDPGDRRRGSRDRARRAGRIHAHALSHRGVAFEEEPREGRLDAARAGISPVGPRRGGLARRDPAPRNAVPVKRIAGVGAKPSGRSGI